MSYELIKGDCRQALEYMPSNSIDSVVTDPPYALVSVQKRFGKSGSAPAQFGSDGLYARASRGFMGKTWDNGEVAFAIEFWSEVLRVLRPGGHVVAFGGTRTYHHLALAIEFGGFEIRDQLGWVYGSGFPKSHNQKDEWEGYGTALKPAWEPICLARKPLDGTVAANLAKWGVGALNIDGCRIDHGGARDTRRNAAGGENGLTGTGTFKIRERRAEEQKLHEGRWPANIVHDGSDEVLAAFPDASGQIAKAAEGKERRKDQNVYGTMTRGSSGVAPRVDTNKSVARFFYCAKASRRDRDEGLDGFEKKPLNWSSGTKNPGSFQSEGTDKSARNPHPTVKPTALMQWLCRLVTPPGGTILDPFLGSGSTGKAAMLEGFNFIGCEREDEYMPIAEARITFAASKASVMTTDKMDVFA